MAATDEEERTALFRVTRTLMEMLLDRGYDIADNELNMTRPQFLEKYGGENLKRENLEMIRSKKDHPNEKIFIAFSKHLNAATIRVNIESMRRDNVRRGIFIVQNKFTPAAKATLQNLNTISVEIFQEQELLINISKHELVPQHILLTKEEKKALLKNYAIKESQLPRILVSDPMARYLGLQRGDVVKIIRNSETAGKYVTYRWVV